MGTLTERLSILVDTYADGKHTKFAKLVGIPPSTFQNYINGRPPHIDHLLHIRETFQVNLDWLLTGEGEMKKSEAEKGEDDVFILYKEEDVDPEVADLLRMTSEIVRSDTEYADSLKANIRSFYHSVELEKRLSKNESDISLIKDGLSAENERLKHQNRLLEDRLAALEKKLSSRPGQPEKVSVNG
ncbi:hypothetical protein PITCH_A1940006 [uncultured Desulfobacterium sp.]|uniref:HTH cro/C1-type domain-containing protein n=1 Tax=uncultured Desulfobacterium sp. TaxID=201089 RepID=A0A445MWA8_9BACT|nr:hypothetical protein PITCH_A1940006 [uncultured Desulfobacterium sp.]